MKQTAVEWLIDEIKFARNLCDDPSAEMDIWHTLDVLISKGEEAKEMEKQQMIDFTLDFMGEDNNHESYRRESALNFFEKTFNTYER